MAIDVEAEQIADRIRIFDTVQPMDQRPTRIGLGDCGAIELGFQPRFETAHGRLVGPRRARRRHGAGAKLPNDFFPNSRARADTVHIQRVEREPSGFQSLVMASNTVLVEECALRRRVRRDGRRLRRARTGRLCAYRRTCGLHWR